MARTIFFLLFISQFADTYSQRSIFLIDEESNLPIEFAVISSIESNYYYTSNSKGFISISESDTGLFSISHVSYKTQLVNFKRIGDTLKLKLNPFQIGQVDISPNENLETFEVGYLNSKSFGYNWFGISNQIEEIAVFISGEEIEKQIKKIYYSIRLPKGTHMLSVKLFAVNENNEPGETIFAKSVEVSKKLKKNILEVSIQGEDLSLNSSGIFIGISVLSEVEVQLSNPENPKLKEIMKSININMTDQLTEALTFIKIRGKWTKFESSTGEHNNMRAGLLLIKD